MLKPRPHTALIKLFESSILKRLIIVVILLIKNKLMMISLVGGRDLDK